MRPLTAETIEMARQGLLGSDWCGFSKRDTVNQLCDLALKGLSASSVPQLGIKDPRPCVHAIGATTCGYPQEHRIHDGSSEPAPPAGRHTYTPPA